MANENIMPYPMMFDQSQWSNKYSDYAGKSLSPYMGKYSGVPTDAHGNPIQSYVDAQTAHDAWNAANPAPTPAATPGTTLNTNPNMGASRMLYQQGLNNTGATSAGMNQYQGSSAAAGLNATGQAEMATASALDPSLGYSPGGAGGLTDWAARQQGINPYPNLSSGGQQSTAPAAAAQTNPIDMNAAYLAALSNPGKVTTPGATVPQSAPPSNQSGVLQQFLQNWQQGGGNTQGAGNYNNQGFFNALKGQV